MKSILLSSLFIAQGVFGSTLLFGPNCPNKLACLSDPYGVGDKPVVPAEQLTKVKDLIQDKIFPVIESSFYTGFSHQISTCVVRLRTEYKNLHEDLIYPNCLYYLSLCLAKDYVRCHIAMTNLSLLKMVHYTQRMLMGYANSNFTDKPHVDPKVRKSKYINGVVYVDIAEKLGRYRVKKSRELREEVDRILGNIHNISIVKATGKTGLLVDSFTGRALLLSVLSSLTFFGFYSLI